MSDSDREGPERRRTPGQFITMDAAMLAAQNQRLEELNGNIVALAKAIGARPTREELDRQRKHDLIRTIAGIAFLFFVLGGFWVQQEQLYSIIDNDRRQSFNICEERNTENAQFLKLLNDLTEGAPAESRAAQVLREYAENLTPTDCQTLLNESR